MYRLNGQTPVVILTNNTRWKQKTSISHEGQGSLQIQQYACLINKLFIKQDMPTGYTAKLL